MIQILMTYQINITDLWENMKKCVKIYAEHFKKFHDKKIHFCNILRKLNTSTEHDLEFLMLLNGNSLQNVTFLQESTKSYRRITFFY